MAETPPCHSLHGRNTSQSFFNLYLNIQTLKTLELVFFGNIDIVANDNKPSFGGIQEGEAYTYIENSIDVFWWKRGETLIPILFLVNIMSRNLKAWAYVLTKERKKERTEINVAILKQFKDEVGFIQGLENDNNFSILQLKIM